MIEVAWAINDQPIRSMVFPHTLVSADPTALRINRYYERGLDRYSDLAGAVVADCYPMVFDLIQDLTGATIVAENYGFDCAVLLRKLGFEPWHYRKVELSSEARLLFNLDHPEGLHETAERLRDLGYSIPTNDHTATADVACLRACHDAITRERARWVRPPVFPLVG